MGELHVREEDDMDIGRLCNGNKRTRFIKIPIVQIRIILMSVFEIRDRGLISMNKFKNLIQYLEGFHFIYNAVLSRRANVVDSPYASSARKLRKCQTKKSRWIDV